jgi:hypothetical protein
VSLLDNLVSYWKLDEASGNALDAHGSNTLTLTGTVGSASGKIGTCRNFPGSASYFQAASNSDFQAGDVDFSFSLWCNASSLSNFRSLVFKDDGSGVNREFGIYYQDSCLKWYVFGSANGGNFKEVASQAILTTGDWFHVVAWHDAANNQIAIALNNGTPSVASHSAGVYAGAAPFSLGGSSTINRWAGLIDEVGFWKRVLTSDERTQLYNSGNGLSYDSFGGGGATNVSWWAWNTFGGAANV